MARSVFSINGRFVEHKDGWKISFSGPDKCIYQEGEKAITFEFSQDGATQEWCFGALTFGWDHPNLSTPFGQPDLVRAQKRLSDAFAFMGKFTKHRFVAPI